MPADSDRHAPHPAVPNDQQPAAHRARTRLHAPTGVSAGTEAHPPCARKPEASQSVGLIGMRVPAPAWRHPRAGARVQARELVDLQTGVAEDD
jgi:hypothetical protein